MAERATGSTVPRRQLGRYLRDLRNQARLTVRSAAHQLEWSEAKMWRIETGQSSLRSFDVETMCKVYGAPADITEALMGLAKETKAKGWWHAYGDVIPEGFDVYIGLEEAASSLASYQNDLVPGLLQTEGYARAVFRRHNPDETEEDVERRVRLRVERQTLLTRVSDPSSLRLVLNEAVLRRPVGGKDVMAGQLAHLVEVAERPNIEIRVASFAAGLHLGMLSGSFIVLRFPTNGDGAETEPPTVYVDGYTGSLYLDKPNEVQSYETAFGDIWESSLGEEASRRLIADTAGSHGQD
ncbi:helix-turn-helix domain-containing protein [Streptomyces sp. CMB-StM0423]|uniref:helix-turn-helix domain-containing protein n=1 Tax=Streptomyces sp. CMB-StM0423 TaxID=2059884 RepID=UPI000C7123DB|nr:helix-turn-helix transcriptional regulator [Streptomyces sp. CMB-StM0423]AUH43267.1 transcriptional regulator [Streptomyces sp. CMB-StM0423]